MAMIPMLLQSAAMMAFFAEVARGQTAETQKPAGTVWKSPAAATASFQPQEVNAIGYMEWAILVCAKTSPVPLTIQGGDVYSAAQSKGVRWVARAKVQEAYRKQAKRSPQRIIAGVLEATMWAGSVAIASGAFKGVFWKETQKPGGVVEREPRKVALLFPSTAEGLRLLTTIVKAEIPSGAIPDNLVPPFAQIPAGGCIEMTMFARGTEPPAPFEVPIQ